MPSADLRRFRVLAGELRDAARLGDLPRVESVLEERRALVSRLNRRPESWLSREPDTRELLEAILELDQEAEHILAARRDSLGKDLVTLDAGRRSLQGYGSGLGRRPKWIDERG